MRRADFFLAALAPWCFVLWNSAPFTPTALLRGLCLPFRLGPRAPCLIFELGVLSRRSERSSLTSRASWVEDIVERLGDFTFADAENDEGAAVLMALQLAVRTELKQPKEPLEAAAERLAAALGVPPPSAGLEEWLPGASAHWMQFEEIRLRGEVKPEEVGALRRAYPGPYYRRVISELRTDR